MPFQTLRAHGRHRFASGIIQALCAAALLAGLTACGGGGGGAPVADATLNAGGSAGSDSTTATGTVTGTATGAGSTSSTTTVVPAILIAGTAKQPLTLTGVVSLFAGSATSGTADGVGTAARFNNPYGITSDGTNLYVADTNSHTIRQINIATQAVTTLAGSGIGGAADGVGTAASFSRPSGITTDGIHVYVADSGNGLIRKISIATGAVSTLAGKVAGHRFSSFADGTGTTAEFGDLAGITTDGANIYVAENGSYRIRKVVIATGVVSTVAGNGTKGYVDASGTNARFEGAVAVSLIGDTLYVSDKGGLAIRQITLSTGQVNTVFSFNAGSSPTGLTNDGANLYATQASGGAVDKITLSSGGAATKSSFLGSNATLTDPYDITSDGKKLFLVNASSHTIYKID